MFYNLRKKFDVVCIGSSTVDVFLELGKGVAKESHHNILYHLGDKLPVEDIHMFTGGGATNTSVALSRLGLKIGIITSVGNDENGKIVINNLKEEKVEFLGTIKKGKTGYSIVLPGHDNRTILVYSGVNNELKMSDIEDSFRGFDTKWLYISTLRGNGLKTIQEVAERLRDKGTRVMMNISSYLASMGVKKLKKILSKLDILILNKEEILLLTKEKQVREALNKLRNYVKGIVVVTDGPKPLYLFNSISGDIQTKNITKIKVADSAGAGDAFASGFLYAIIKGETPQKALDYGYEEAKSVLGHIGAKNNLLRKITI